jgi:glycerol-3-phosphate O-acyltransferase/dihydroxyacetone phosphate acyltransferase
MFVNPISRAIVLSSGCIPVKRNPNNTNSNGGQHNPLKAGSLPLHQADLFRETSTALGSGHVIGVFPEGTSYTEPSIVQIMPGAAWAAVEYARWEREQQTSGVKGKQREKGRGLTILPVGIVYTDKSKYLSRVSGLFSCPYIFVHDVNTYAVLVCIGSRPVSITFLHC